MKFEKPKLKIIGKLMSIVAFSTVLMTVASCFNKDITMVCAEGPDGVVQGDELTASDVGKLSKDQYQAFNGWLTIPANFTEMKWDAFEECKAKVVLFGGNIEKLPAFAFYGNKFIKKVYLPDSCIEIGDFCFGECSSLNEVVFGQNLRSIGTGAFCGCISLNKIEIPNSLYSAGEGVFDNSGIRSITIPSGVPLNAITGWGTCPNLTSITCL